MMVIKKALLNDFKDIWPIFKSVISTGDTYVFPPDMSFEDAQTYWMSPNHYIYLVTYNDQVAGTYILKANHIGLGSHVSNASFMVHPDFQGKGIGKLMADHCLKEAKRLGFKAMQFNIVISTNEPAITLWKKLGFQIIGTTPQAFQHQSKGLVDTYIMYKKIQ